MASLVFDKIEIDGVDYTQHLNESFEVQLEPASTMIKDGQTKIDYYDVTFSVKLYDSNVLSNSKIYKDASQTPQVCDIKFSGVTGARSILITDVIVNAVNDYEEQSSCVRVYGSKRAVSLAAATTES